MPDQIFGPVHSFNDAELALKAHVKMWMDTYLAVRERSVGIVAGTIQRPKSWLVKQSFHTLPGEAQMPCIIVVSDGFSEAPHRHGDGTWDVKLRMAVAGLSHGSEATQARALAGHYQAACTMMLLQKRSFGPCTLDDWLDLRMEDVDNDQERTLAAFRLELVYKIEDFIDGSTSPPAVPDNPLAPQPDLGQVQTHSETTEAT